MKVEKYKRGDLILMPGGHNSCKIDFNYFYDKQYGVEDIHLLEHVMLDSWRILPSLNKKINELMEPFLYFNGYTTGLLLNTNMQASNEKINELLPVMIAINNDTLVIDEEVINHEMDLLEFESGYASSEYQPQFFDFKGFHQDKTEGNVKKVVNLYASIVQNNRVRVFVKGNLDNSHILQAIQTLREWLGQRTIEEVNFAKDSRAIAEYHPRTQIATQDGDTHEVMHLLYSFDNYDKALFPYYILHYDMIKWCLEEYVRDIEQTDYKLSRSYRTTHFAAFQTYFNIKTNKSPEQILALIEKMFYKNEEWFHKLKQKTVEKKAVYSDHPDSYYFIMLAHYFVQPHYQTFTQAQQEVVAIDYKSFVEFYKKSMKHISISLY